MTKEFYDLEDLKLNINPQSGERHTSWGNLGYWQQDNTDNYPKAAQQLAAELASFAQLTNLQHGDCLFDAGFGCGDQLLIWQQHLSGNSSSEKTISVDGLNISTAQTKLAQQQYSPNSHLNIQQGDACNFSHWQNLNSRQACYTKILALDCFYHFQDKNSFLDIAEKKLTQQGQIILTDLLLSDDKITLIDKFFLRFICNASNIPFADLRTLTNYQTNLASKGFKLAGHKDITAQVFVPFNTWLQEFLVQLKKQQPQIKIFRIKYLAVGYFLRRCAQKNLLTYQMLKIQKD